ncbi:MAG: hypothetical protein RBT11_17870 [Desulfobacterales bacterium]|jgi:hypothetical protein|nr:hypothetical protein [Desulfobacterales bacterium]
MDRFTLAEALNILEIDRGRMNEWLSRGLIETEHEIKKGSRTHKEYSTADLYAIAIFKTLIEYGQIPRDTASKVAKAWRDSVKKYGVESCRDPIFILRKEDGFELAMAPIPMQTFKDQGSGAIFNLSVLRNMELIRDDTTWKIMFVLNIGVILAEVDVRLSV